MPITKESKERKEPKGSPRKISRKDHKATKEGLTLDRFGVEFLRFFLRLFGPSRRRERPLGGAQLDGQRFRHRLKDSTERAGAGCEARLGPLGPLLFL